MSQHSGRSPRTRPAACSVTTETPHGTHAASQPTDVTPPSRPEWLWNRIARILLYDDIGFVIYATVPAVVLGSLVSGVVRRRRRTS